MFAGYQLMERWLCYHLPILVFIGLPINLRAGKTVETFMRVYAVAMVPQFGSIAVSAVQASGNKNRALA